MYKVVLADDNELSRKAIKKSVSWKNSSCRVIGEAGNGPEALRLIRETGAEIALLDIKMPGMTGLEVVKALHEENRECVCILVTAYDDFSFAREGLKLGVFDYLLKPVVEEELQDVIRRAVEQLDVRERQTGQENRRRLLNESIRGHSGSMEELQRFYQAGGRFREYCLLLVSSDEQIPEQALEEILEDCQKRQNVWLLDTWCGEGIVILCVFREILFSREYELTALRIGNRIVDGMHAEGIQVMVSISEVGQKASQCQQLYEHAVFGRNSRFFLENQAVVHYDSLRSRSNHDKFELMEHLEEFYGICRRQPERMAESLDSFLELLGKDESYDVEYVRNILIHVGIMMTYLVREKGIRQQEQKSVDEIMKEMSDCATVQEAFSWLTSYAGELSGIYASSRKYSVQTKRILDYLNQNYQRHISLQDAADALKLSETHICRLLKNDTGETFVTLLNKIRIQEAIRLLKSGEWKVYEVAEQVGFGNYAYFYQLFKKETGCSPTDLK